MSPRSIALVCLIVVGCREQANDTPLASVNGNPISRDQYYRYLERKPTVSVIAEGARGVVDARVSSPLSIQAINDLVNRKLLSEVADEKGINPQAADLDKEIAFRESMNGRFRSDLKDQGLSEEEIRSDIRMDLIQERLWTEGIEVTEFEVTRYIDDHPQEFLEPARIQLSWVIVADSKTRSQFDQAVKTGNSFEEAARTYTVLRTGTEPQVAFPETRTDRLPPYLQRVLASLEAGEATPWLPDNNRWIKLFVESRESAKKIEISAVVKERIRRTLAIRKGRAINDIAKMLATKKESAEIKVNDPVLARLWNRAMQKTGS